LGFLILTEENPLLFLFLTMGGVLLTRFKKLTSSRVKSILGLAPPILMVSLAVGFAFYRLYGYDEVVRTLLGWGFGVFVVSLILFPMFKRVFRIKK
jgi:hypothetical protein